MSADLLGSMFTDPRYPLPLMNPKQRVYFAAVGDIVKIGHTADLDQRLKSLRYGSSCARPDGYHYSETVILGAIPGGRGVESMLHDQLAEHRVLGEWFRLSDTVIRTIAHFLYGDPEPAELGGLWLVRKMPGFRSAS